MEKKIVIAGNQRQALEWAQRDCERRFTSGETSVSLSEYHMTPTVNTIRGNRNPHGVFVGTWRNRPDIKDLVQQLFFSTDIDTPSYQTLLTLMKTL